MCLDPVTMLTIASTAVGAIGKLQEGDAAASAAKYNAAIAGNNAKISQQNANLAAEEGNQKVEQESMKNKAKVGAILANQGASGVDVNSGSSVGTRQSQEMVGAENALNIRASAARTAYGYETQASNFEAQQNLNNAEAKSDKTAGEIGAATTLLGGAASSYKDYVGANSLNASQITNYNSMLPTSYEPAQQYGEGLA